MGYEFLRKELTEAYGAQRCYSIIPSLKVSYRGMTLVHEWRRERITWDFDLSFSKGGVLHGIAPGYVVVKTKTASSNGDADRILEAWAPPRAKL